MIKFLPFESALVPMPIDNIDTDQIIPARFLKTISKAGLGDQLFFDWRYDSEGNPKPDFILNTCRRPQGVADPVWRAIISVVAVRAEHAPWALTQYGFRAVISTSFADIFKQNSLKNSLLPIVVPRDVHAALFADPGARVKIDLQSQTADASGWPGGGVPSGRLCEALFAGRNRRTRLYPATVAPAITAFESTHPAQINALVVNLHYIPSPPLSNFVAMLWLLRRLFAASREGALASQRRNGAGNQPSRRSNAAVRPARSPAKS